MRGFSNHFHAIEIEVYFIPSPAGPGVHSPIALVLQKTAKKEKELPHASTP